MTDEEAHPIGDGFHGCGACSRERGAGASARQRRCVSSDRGFRHGVERCEGQRRLSGADPAAPTEGGEPGVPIGNDPQARRTASSTKYEPHRAKEPANGALDGRGAAPGSDAKGQ